MAPYLRILSDGHYDSDDCHEDCAAAPPPPAVAVLIPPAVSDNHHRHISNLLFIGAAIFACALLLTITYYAVLRRRRVRGLLQPFPATPPATGGVAAQPSDDDVSSIDDGEPVHHVWHIRTVGLDEATIDSISAAEYKAGDPLLVGASDCTVCLVEFCDGDLVRLLPKCGHAFHVHCIDTWLRAHVNCPLCHALIVDPNVEPVTGVPAPPGTVVGTSALASDSSAPAERAQIEVQLLEEEQTRDRVETVIDIGIPVNPIEALDSSPEISLSMAQSDMGENGLQPVRRSVSMDSPFMDPITDRVEAEEGANGQKERKDANFGEENVLKNRGRQGNTSKWGSDRKVHLEIERSLSSSGRGYFFLRHGRVSRNSSLPM